MIGLPLRTVRNHRTRVGAVFVFVAASGCSSRTTDAASSARPAPSVDPSVPRDVALGYFDALAKRDCDALKASIGGAVAAKVDKGGCGPEFEEFEHHHMRIASAEPAAPDGRNENVYLVRVNASQDGKERVIVVGVERLEGRWAVTRI
jgi:hypothetical protein